MQNTIIVDTDVFSLTSYGSGVGYSFEHKPSKSSVFFQGDAAADFREEWERLEDARPMWNTNRIFHELWSDYACIAEPTEVVRSAA